MHSVLLSPGAMAAGRPQQRRAPLPGPSRGSREAFPTQASEDAYTRQVAERIVHSNEYPVVHGSHLSDRGDQASHDERSVQFEESQSEYGYWNMHSRECVEGLGAIRVPLMADSEVQLLRYEDEGNGEGRGYSAVRLLRSGDEQSNEGRGYSAAQTLEGAASYGGDEEWPWQDQAEGSMPGEALGRSPLPAGGRSSQAVSRSGPGSRRVVQESHGLVQQQSVRSGLADLALAGQETHGSRRVGVVDHARKRSQSSFSQRSISVEPLRGQGGAKEGRDLRERAGGRGQQQPGEGKGRKGKGNATQGGGNSQRQAKGSEKAKQVEGREALGRAPSARARVRFADEPKGEEDAVEEYGEHDMIGDRRATMCQALFQSPRSHILGKAYRDLHELYEVQGRELGAGRYGVIRKCTEIASGQVYACKVISKREVILSEDAEGIRTEVMCLATMKGQPGVISIKDTVEDRENVYIVMELCRGGDLYDRISQQGPLAEPDAARMFAILIKALSKCHAMGIMHRDVKPENILLTSKQSNCDIKLVDFGVSTFFQPGKPLRAVAGTRMFMAPEVLRKRYGPEADIWSAGVLLYVALSGCQPFRGRTERELARSIKEDDVTFRSSKWDHISDDALDLIWLILDKDPGQRISCRKILKHPWIRMHTGKGNRA